MKHWFYNSLFSAPSLRLEKIAQTQKRAIHESPVSTFTHLKECRINLPYLPRLSP